MIKYCNNCKRSFEEKERRYTVCPVCGNPLSETPDPHSEYRQGISLEDYDQMPEKPQKWLVPAAIGLAAAGVILFIGTGSALMLALNFLAAVLLIVPIPESLRQNPTVTRNVALIRRSLASMAALLDLTGFMMMMMAGVLIKK